MRVPVPSSILVFVFLLSIGCDGSSAAPSPRSDADAPADTPDTAVALDTGIHAQSPWQAVEELFLTRSAEAGATDLGLSIWNRRDVRIFERTLGTFTSDTRVAIASASKLVAGLVLFDVVRDDRLSLDSTTGRVLGWTGAGAGITLRHLLSFTSGLPKEAACTLIAATTTAACADRIAGESLVAPPGTLYEYGSTHLHVAARMAEVATGLSWAELFDKTLRLPLGLSPEVACYTRPRQAEGKTNPLIAGGMRASVNDYRGFLALAFHKGTFGNVTVGTPALFDEQAHEPFPNVPVGFTPVESYRYGLASWLLCDTPAQGCASLASPGAFGFTPWFDREAGYYAILGMELPRETGDNGVVQFAFLMMRELQPLIAAAVKATSAD
jgi:D-alanyl-D-alanine-carboxypeptidase/D-alanyl-D-alanine-endopeptidase